MRLWSTATRNARSSRSNWTPDQSRSPDRHRIGIEPLEERAMLAVFHVSLLGDDANDGSSANPFRTIQTAIDAAAAANDGDDEIRVAGGDYNEAGIDLGFVIPLDDEITSLDIVGGFDTSFTTRDLAGTPTNYTPQNESGQVVISDAAATVDGFNFVFDGTADGVVVLGDDVTLRELVVSNANHGVTAAMLTNLTVDGVVSKNNARNGFGLDGVGGTLEIRNSIASDNGQFGMLISSAGTINLLDCSASNNRRDGINVDGANELRLANTVADENRVHGLFAASVAGPVSISGGTFNSNMIGDGIQLDTVGDVSIANGTRSNSNQDNGIEIVRPASLSVDAAIASSNVGVGLSVFSVDGPVTLVNSTFHANKAGVDIIEAGSVTVTDVRADGNTHGGGFSATYVPGLVDITNGTFNLNSFGLGVGTAAGLIASNVIATSNSAFGLGAFDVGGPVTVAGGNYDNNLRSGLELRNIHSLNLKDLTARDNGDHGIEANTVIATQIANLTLQGNESGRGAEFYIAPTIFFQASSGVAADVIELTDTEIRHTRAGVSQQPIVLLSSVTTMTIDAGPGNDLITVAGQPASIGVAALTILGGDGDDTLVIHEPTSTARPFPTTLQVLGGDGNDGFELNLGRPAADAAFSVDGGAGTNGLTVFTRSAASDTVTIDSTQVIARVHDAKTIKYSNLSGVAIYAGDGNDSLTIDSLLAGNSPSAIALYGQDGDDTIQAIGSLNNARVDLSGGAGMNLLRADTLSGYADYVEVDGATIATRRGPDPLHASPDVIHYESFAKLDVATGGGNDTVVITQPASGAFPDVVNLATQDENDAIEINLGKPFSETAFNINGGNGTDGITVFTRSPNDDNTNVSIEQFTVLMRPTPTTLTIKYVRFYEAEAINLLFGDGNNGIHFSNTSFGPDFQRFSVFGQGGNDRVSIGFEESGHQELIEFDGSTGDDNRLTVGTGFSNMSDVVNVDSVAVQVRLGADPLLHPTKTVAYSNIQLLDVHSFGGEDSVTINQLPGAPGLPEAISISTGEQTDEVVVDARFVPDTVGISIHLGAHDDELTIKLPPHSLQATIHVDGGADSAGDWLTAIADSDTGTEIAVGTFNSGNQIRVASIEWLILIGGAGSDTITNNTSTNSILDGLGGNDWLFGGSGRDLILGETGVDVLRGEDSDDLLIAGPVVFDLHQFSLLAILAEWTSTRTFAERVANLSGTGSGARENGEVFLRPGINVFDEDDGEELSGGASADWFIARGAGDTIVDLMLEDLLTSF